MELLDKEDFDGLTEGGSRSLKDFQASKIIVSSSVTSVYKDIFTIFYK